jgi:Tfp pilus assembly protein FimT
MVFRLKSETNRRRSADGHTIVELAAALSIATIAATGVISGVTSLRDAISLLSARQQLAGALEYARRETYRRGATSQVQPDQSGRVLRVTIAGLPERVFLLQRSRVVDQPTRGHVRFFASGLAENATFTIANVRGDEADIVVNQRGEIRWR